MKFSIVVPVFNVEQYLSRCIESVLSQTFKDFELILVDDGSTDSSGAICDRYAEKDNRIRVIHKKNGGVSTARNTGIEISSGEYITFCDSDDYYKNMLLEIVAAYLEDSSVDLLSYNFDLLYHSELKKGSSIDIGTFFTDSPKKILSLIINHTFTSYLGWSMCTSFIKARIIKDNDLRVCTLCNNYAEDIGFGLKVLFHVKKVVGISDSLYVYDRTREESMTHQNKGVYKCNDVNEVAFDVWCEFGKVFGNPYEQYYSILFFQLMNGEYAEMIWQKQIRSLPSEVKKILRKKWYVSQTKQVLKSKEKFLDYYDTIQVDDYMAMARYCLHGSYMRYHIECWINHQINKYILGRQKNG